VTLRLIVEQGKHGLWYVTSPDEKGLIAIGKTMHTALQSVHSALKQLRDANKTGD
jgi:predicted RNase H-like HicB family nuclease